MGLSGVHPLPHVDDGDDLEARGEATFSSAGTGISDGMPAGAKDTPPPLDEIVTAGGEGRLRRMLTGENFLSSMSNRRRQSEQVFQSHIANEEHFAQVLHGEEMEDPLPYNESQRSRMRAPQSFLLRLKINTFAVPLGLSSQALMWGNLSDSALVTKALGQNIPDTFQWAFWVLALVLLVTVSFGYMLKAIFYWGAVRREWAHPVRSNFMFTPLLTSITITAAVPEVIINELHPQTPTPMSAYILLTVLVLMLEISAYGKWLFSQDRSLRVANPSYQLAVVGNFLVAALGTRVRGSPSLEMACDEVSRFFFAVGSLYLFLVFFAIQHHSADNVKADHTSDHLLASADEKAPLTIEAPKHLQPDPAATNSTALFFKNASAAATANANEEGRTASGRSSKVGPSPKRPEHGSVLSSERGSHWELQHSFDTLSSSGQGLENLSNNSGESPQHHHHHHHHHHHASSATASKSGSPTSLAPCPQAPVHCAGSSPPKQKLSRALHPIYFLFVAPPSAAAVAWAALAGEFDMLAKSFLFIAGFLYMFFLLGNWRFLKTNQFTLAWWAYSFPSSTFAVASILYAEELDSQGVAIAAFVLSLASTALVLFVFVVTVCSAVKGTLFENDMVVVVKLLEEEE